MEHKRVVIPVDVANEIIENGHVEYDYYGEMITITEDDVDKEGDCCFRSAKMVDGPRVGHRECIECGRQFDERNILVGFSDTHVDDVIVHVPRSEFLESE